MREYNAWTTITFAMLYTIMVVVLGAVEAGDFCDSQFCDTEGRLINNINDLALFALPLIGLAVVHTVWYGRSKQD